MTAKSERSFGRLKRFTFNRRARKPGATPIRESALPLVADPLIPSIPFCAAGVDKSKVESGSDNLNLSPSLFLRRGRLTHSPLARDSSKRESRWFQEKPVLRQ